jgi:hypothetical protein
VQAETTPCANIVTKINASMHGTCASFYFYDELKQGRSHTWAYKYKVLAFFLDEKCMVSLAPIGMNGIRSYCSI